MLSSAEMRRVEELADGNSEPTTGFEKHLVGVRGGKGSACTRKEKEWFDYWLLYEANDCTFIPDLGPVGAGKDQFDDINELEDLLDGDQTSEDKYQSQVISLENEIDTLYEKMVSMRDKNEAETKNYMEIIYDLRQRLLSRDLN
jgi:hypothetical protein